MKRPLLLYLLISLLIQSVLFAQRKQLLKQYTHKAILEQLQREYTSDASKKRETARSIAKQKGWPIKEILEDGTLIELQRLTPSGRPIYYKTHNLIAAHTVSTNKVWPGGDLGLELTGAGVTVGEWDGGAVLLTHQELSGRATQVDGVTAVSNHSTHVAGTLIAQGIGASARGMAYQATLNAYDWNDDNAEMAAAAANGLLFSNHSYGVITGWEFNFRNDFRWAWFGDPEISETEDYHFGFYSEESKVWDEIAYNAPQYLIVKSAGNDRNTQGAEPDEQHWVMVNGEWALVTADRNPDGDHGCIAYYGVAKNVLTVGAVQDIPSGYSKSDDVFMTSFSC